MRRPARPSRSPSLFFSVYEEPSPIARSSSLPCSEFLTFASRILFFARGTVESGKRVLTRAQKIRAMHLMPILSAPNRTPRSSIHSSEVHQCGGVSRHSSEVHLDEHGSVRITRDDEER